jgi:hypothetical protein
VGVIGVWYRSVCCPGRCAVAVGVMFQSVCCTGWCAVPVCVLYRSVCCTGRCDLLIGFSKCTYILKVCNKVPLWRLWWTEANSILVDNIKMLGLTSHCLCFLQAAQHDEVNRKVTPCNNLDTELHLQNNIYYIISIYLLIIRLLIILFFFCAFQILFLAKHFL